MSAFADLNPFSEACQEDAKYKESVSHVRSVDGQRRPTLHELKHGMTPPPPFHGSPGFAMETNRGVLNGPRVPHTQPSRREQNVRGVHISDLLDFDPLASTQPAPHQADNAAAFKASEKNTDPPAPRDEKPFLQKNLSEVEDLQKLSMLVSRGTLNEAERMVARDLVVDRVPGISAAIDSAVCKNKGKLLSFITEHQSMPIEPPGSAQNDDNFDIFGGKDFGLTEPSSEKKRTSWTSTLVAEDHTRKATADDWYRSTPPKHPGQTAPLKKPTPTPSIVVQPKQSRADPSFQGVQSPVSHFSRDDPQVTRVHPKHAAFKFTPSGAMVGRCIQRVTSKKILRKWSPRYFVLTPNALSLYKEAFEWETGAQPKLLVPIHKLMMVTDVYLFTKEDKVPGPKRAHQFKIIENKLSSGESASQYQTFSRRLASAEVCKVGHVDQSAARALREHLADLIREQQNRAGASLGKQHVSGRYDTAVSASSGRAGTETGGGGSHGAGAWLANTTW